VYFSPLNDSKLPENIHGLILSGGYPELYAERLSDNISMRESIYKAVNDGLPTIAECGGFLYLHDELEDNAGKAYQMAGVIHARGCKTQRLQRFGYMTMKAEKDNVLAKKGEEFSAHEFHYWSSTDLGHGFSIKKASDGSAALGVHVTKTMYAGFPHIYFYGNRKAAERFLQKAYERMEKKDEFAVNAWN
jgi:cobyrinic acid a,c-diamide synthase